MKLNDFVIREVDIIFLFVFGFGFFIDEIDPIQAKKYWIFLIVSSLLMMCVNAVNKNKNEKNKK